MKRLIIVLSLIFAHFIGIYAQSLTLLKQVKMSRWDIPAANYSGIFYLGDDRYAVVSDKQKNDGYYEFLIRLNEESGEVEHIEQLAFHHTTEKPRDAEGICFSRHTGKLYIAAEDDQQILEYLPDGSRTGRKLHIPSFLSKNSIYSNYGFESLTFSDETALFWTCTENSLKKDGAASSFSNPTPALIHLQSFGTDMLPHSTFPYLTEAPEMKRQPRHQAFGVTDLTALDDGSLLVLEREFFVAKRFIGSYVKNRIFKVTPSTSLTETTNISQSLGKTLLAEWTTRLNITRRNIANYEGMCLGPKLKDGRQTILLISDSQGGYGNSLFHLKDYIRVGILTSP